MTSTATTTSQYGDSRQFRALVAINTADFIGAVGLERVRPGRRALEWLCRPAARRFAREVLAFDSIVGQAGLAAGGAWALDQFVARATFSGHQRLPRSGPLLIVSNHPGMCDAPAIFAALGRDDLHVIAADRDFLRALPHTMRRLYILDERAAASKRAVLRAGARHLRQGGALLTFPAGLIEPDPAVLPGAYESLDRWSASLELFPRLVPGLTVVPVIVSGVLSPAAQRNPLRYLRRREKDRRWLAAMFQVVLKRYQNVHVRVAFGAPLQSTREAGVGPVILDEARRLIRQASD